VTTWRGTPLKTINLRISNKGCVNRRKGSEGSERHSERSEESQACKHIIDFGCDNHARMWSLDWPCERTSDRSGSGIVNQQYTCDCGSESPSGFIPAAISGFYQGHDRGDERISTRKFKSGGHQETRRHSSEVACSEAVARKSYRERLASVATDRTASNSNNQNGNEKDLYQAETEENPNAKALVQIFLFHTMTPIQHLFIIIGLIFVGFGYMRYYVKTRTNDLKDQLDGRLTQLLTVTKSLARAEGMAEGIIEGTASERASQKREKT
jgi:hypothetical protein